MNVQRMFALVKKDLKKTVREPAILFLILLFPLILTLAFGLAFGAIGTSETTYTMAVIDSDGSYNPWSGQLIGNLSESEMLDTVGYADNSTAQADLAQGKIDAIIIIPLNFSESADSYLFNPENESAWINSTLDIYLDGGSMIITQALSPVIQQVLLVTLLGPNATTVSMPIQVGNPAAIESSTLSQFDFMAPGLFAYASIFLTMTVAQSLTDDKDKGLLKRLAVTPMTSSEFMVSHASSNMIIALMQTGIILLVSTLVGFQPGVGFGSYLMVLLIVLLFSLCNVGFGLITASVAKSSGSATGLSFIFIIPQMFLGSFIPIPGGIGKFVPSYYVTDALTSLFLRGAPVFSSTVLLDLLVVSMISIGTLIAGILLYGKFGKK